jgi:hypothetical protein
MPRCSNLLYALHSHKDSIKYDPRGHECKRLWLQAKIGEYKSVYEMFSDQAGIGFANRNGCEMTRQSVCPVVPTHSFSVFTERWLSARAVQRLGQSHGPR